MDQPNAKPEETADASEPAALVRSHSSHGGALRPASEADLATVRQMMEVLFTRFDHLQQNNAMQWAGMHERLDAVELEIPLIQEQNALRLRDMEARMSAEIEEAATRAAEDATAGVHAEVSGTLVSLSALI